MSNLKNKGDWSKVAMKDYSNCLVLVNKNGTVKFGERHMFIKMVGIDTGCHSGQVA